MKVTVYFGPVRIIVPVVDDKMTVRELIADSVRRYKKACGMADNSWIYVHNLKSCNDGGIFDPDDLVVSIADDREQILAIYEEDEDATRTPPRRFGRSPSINSEQASRTGSSIDRQLFNAYETLRESERFRKQLITRTDTQEVSVDTRAQDADIVDHQRARLVDEIPDEIEPFEPESAPSASLVDQTSQEQGSFVRSAARKSRITDEWLDIAAKASEDWWKKQEASATMSMTDGRPLCADKNVIHLSISPSQTPKLDRLFLTPKYGSNNKLESLLIESNKESALESLFMVGDEILEINDCSVALFTFDEVYRFLETICRDQTLRLKLLRLQEAQSENGDMSKQPKESVLRSPCTAIKSDQRSALQKANTRKEGVKLEVRLCKEADGLGFTVTSRDLASVTNMETPIYVKNILPKGSAVSSGLLKAGDRLLKINNISLNGMSQQDVVQLLRHVKVGDYVDLVVSRQEESTLGAGPTQIEPMQNIQPKEPPTRRRSTGRKKFLQFDVALNNTGSAGLGVSVKGRISTRRDGTGPERRDLGIFIKSIMHGGAAFKDGRLKVDDQLVAVNDMNLSDCTNMVAIERLRTAMQAVSPNAKTIRLSVLRLLSPPAKQPSTCGADLDNSQMAKKQVTFDDTRKPTSSQSSTPSLSEDWSLGHSPHLGDTTVVEEDLNYWSGSTTMADGASFIRDGLGRQSMSEKRRGSSRHTPSGSQFYQRMKHERQVSAPSASQKPSNTCPGSPVSPDARFASSANFRRRLSVSLENFGSSQVQCCSAEVAVDNQKPDRSNTSKSRPTNDSFRAALNRSSQAFDIPPERQRIVDPHAVKSSMMHVRCANFMDTDGRFPGAQEEERSRSRRKSAVSSLSSLKNFLRWGSTGKSKSNAQKCGATSPLVAGSTLNFEEEKQRLIRQFNAVPMPQRNGTSRIANDGRSKRPLSTMPAANGCQGAQQQQQQQYVPFSRNLDIAEDVYDTVDERSRIGEYLSKIDRTYEVYCSPDSVVYNNEWRPALRPLIPPPDYDQYLRRRSLKYKVVRKPRPVSEMQDCTAQESFMHYDEEVLDRRVDPFRRNDCMTRL